MAKRGGRGRLPVVLYISDLPKSATWWRLRRLLGRHRCFGVRDVKLVWDPAGAHGVAVVTLRFRSAERALAAELTLDGRRLRVATTPPDARPLWRRRWSTP